MPPTTPKRRKLTRDQRLQIITLRGVGITYANIANHLHVTERAVQYTLEAGHPTPSKSSGRPLKLNVAQTTELIEFITSSKEARRISYTRLASETSSSTGTSPNTLYAIHYENTAINAIQHSQNRRLLRTI